MKIFPIKVLPDSSGDEHVGFFRCFDRLQHDLQKIRNSRPTILVGNFCTISRGRDVHRHFISRADGLDRGIGARLLL